MLAPPVKPKSCTHCGKDFLPQRMGQRVCGPVCARRSVVAQKKLERAQTREQLERLKKLPKLHSEAQKAVNAWVRWRDADQPCISCGTPPPDLRELHAGRDAGHYRSIGSAPNLRYDLANINSQCVRCNQFGAGRAVEYRQGLIARIGLAEVERLESDNAPHKWERDEVRAIRDEFRARLREVKAKARAT